MPATLVPQKPVIGIVGSAGAFGRWFKRFFEQRMGLTVIGRDPNGDATLSTLDLIERADVLIFSAPIRATAALIGEYAALAAGRERGKLWLDLTSIKAAPVAAMLRSQAEVVGLHPMTAPPKTPTLKSRVLVVCEARLDAWRAWFAQFLAATEADCVRAQPEQHDRIMATVQGMTHATHMAQAATLHDLAPALGGLDAIHPFRTVGYELDGVVTRRMLAGNPAIYEDIQFENPHIGAMLERLAAHIDFLRDRVREGGDPARAAMRERLLAEPRGFHGGESLAEGNYGFERLGYLLADLASPAHISVFLPLDRPGSLRALLQVFEELAINLDSIHSSRTPDGELHFRIGYDPASDPEKVKAAVAAIGGRGIGRVLAPH
ncbi:MAG: prephenate dehydrogenase [Rudaea sp.]|uniref:prephenate dehydrogenase n=1 Tax=Rudaea sp. TaxID=2136325 RepID=UPI0039E2CB2F